MRIEYLLAAYRRLEGASNRAITSAHEADIESALTDIQLLGSPSQVALAHDFANSFAKERRADSGPLLDDLRDSLRRELLLDPVQTDRAVLRIARDVDRFGPTINTRSWVVWGEKYITSAGRASVFVLVKTRQEIRVEPRQDSVALGWTLDRPFVETASHLARSASGTSTVLMASAGLVNEFVERGDQLTELLRQAPGIELIRIERDLDTIIWEVHPRATGGELSVIASDWLAAAHVAIELGDSEVAASLPDLTHRLAT